MTLKPFAGRIIADRRAQEDLCSHSPRGNCNVGCTAAHSLVDFGDTGLRRTGWFEYRY
jgi:hypothetical protein